jgi:hypothetical protein
LRTRIDAIRAHLPPAHTILLAASWRFPQYYLPEYPLVDYGIGSRWEVDEGRPTASAERWIDPVRAGAHADERQNLAIVLFDDDLTRFNRSADRLEWIPLAHGERLAVLRTRAGEGLRLLPDSFQVAVLDPMRGGSSDR